MTRQIVRIRSLAIAVILVLFAAMVLTRALPMLWMRISNPMDYTSQIKRSATRHGVDPYLVTALIRVESGFDPGVRSSRGAIGLMQVMPATSRDIAHRRERPLPDLYRPAANVDVGTYYLKQLIARYGSEAYALAAYNGGQANVDRWIAGRQAESPEAVVQTFPFKETREFVSKVLKTRMIYRTLYPHVFD